MRLKKITRYGVIASLLVSLDAAAFSSGLTGYSGHPSETDTPGTCSYCHFNGPGTVPNACGVGTGNFDYTGVISAGTPNPLPRGGSTSVTYSMTRNTGALIGLGGMGSRINSGSFSDGGTLINISNSAGNNTATHNGTSNSPSGGNISWNWTWNAPTTAGTYTMYTCGNPTDGTGNCNNDGPHTGTCTNYTFVVENANPIAVNDGSGASPFLIVSEDVAGATTTGDVEFNDTDADSALGDDPAVKQQYAPWASGIAGLQILLERLIDVRNQAVDEFGEPFQRGRVLQPVGGICQGVDDGFQGLDLAVMAHNPIGDREGQRFERAPGFLQAELHRPPGELH